ncbi:protein Wnt [Elysia marginata]|uniref:Protein Wnt n=1 Tax=Elysia marginata TaxID=1093978 RepID=A0AAV4GDR7_9GAST|nr:protein Wnt [Elysia marginata]
MRMMTNFEVGQLMKQINNDTNKLLAATGKKVEHHNTAAQILTFYKLQALPLATYPSYRALAQMSSLAHINDKGNCEDLSGLVKRQRRICRRNIELMDSVRVGALMAIDECQAQFKYRRWNCSTENNLKLFGNVILKQGQ